MNPLAVCAPPLGRTSQPGAKEKTAPGLQNTPYIFKLFIEGVERLIIHCAFQIHAVMILKTA